MMKELMNGRPVEWNGKELELTWAQGRPDIPLYVAAYGPRALGVAGRVGDGVIIQLADPVIIQWIMEQARAAAVEAGRDPDELQCLVCAPSIITDDMQEAREAVRWFPAMVSNHVMDLIERYGENSEIPKDLTDYVKARKFYDYKDHSREGAAHGEFVTDEICDRFSRDRQRRAGDRKAQGARVDRRRPLQHLPHDPRPGGHPPRLRERDHPAVQGRSRLAARRRAPAARVAGSTGPRSTT